MQTSALDRALATLEKTTGFSSAFEAIVVRRGGWPNRWMTPTQINDELTARHFWTRGRHVVNPDGRVRLITHYLDSLVDQPSLPDAADDFWGDGSSLNGKSSASAAASSGGGWKRFDGQYKLNPQTKLVEYRGAKMGRSFDRRSYQRIPVDGVSCQYGPVLNMSAMGLMFCTVSDRAFSVGQRGYLRISHGDVSLRFRGKIVWVGPTEHGTRVGIDYRGLSADDQKTIQDIILVAGDPDDDRFERRKTPR
ncbi:MAG: PilZ domain-containing protein [Planctomycetota bacterium]